MATAPPPTVAWRSRTTPPPVSGSPIGSLHGPISAAVALVAFVALAA
jgi:hypothetical protein